MRVLVLRLLVAVLTAVPLVCVRAEEGRVIAVIVAAQSPMLGELHPNDLSLVYWRKKLYGAHGQVLHPANLHAEHPLRLHFSEWVLHTNPSAQLGYWNGLYFHGIQPPFTVQSEEAMIRYVADTEHAIGYIDACHLDNRVKPVIWVTASKLSSEQPLLHCEGAQPN